MRLVAAIAVTWFSQSFLAVFACCLRRTYALAYMSNRELLIQIEAVSPTGTDFAFVANLFEVELET